MIVFGDFVTFFAAARGVGFFLAATRDATIFFAAAFFAMEIFVDVVLAFTTTFAREGAAFVNFAVLFGVEVLDTTTRTTFFDAPADAVRFDGCLVFCTFFKDAPHSVIAGQRNIFAKSLLYNRFTPTLSIGHDHPEPKKNHSAFFLQARGCGSLTHFRAHSPPGLEQARSLYKGRL